MLFDTLHCCDNYKKIGIFRNKYPWLLTDIDIWVKTMRKQFEIIYKIKPDMDT